MATLYDLDQHYHLDHLIHRDYPARLDNPDHSYLPDQFNHVMLTTCLELDWNNLQKRIIDWIFVKFEKKIFHNYYLQKKLFGTTICQNILWNHNLTKRIFWNNDLQKLFGTTFAKYGQLQQFATILSRTTICSEKQLAKFTKNIQNTNLQKSFSGQQFASGKFIN